MRRCFGGDKTLSGDTARFNLIDIVLFLRALRLVRQAQRVQRAPVADVMNIIMRRGGGGHQWPVWRVELASARAVARWRLWFGGIDTCLTRSLVLGGMLAERGNVALNIGFRPGEKEPAPDGHAWVTIDGSPVGRDGGLAEERYTRVLTIPFSCDPGDDERLGGPDASS